MSDGNGALPEGWAEADLGEVSDVQWGNTSLTKKSYTEEGFTAFSASGPDGFLDHFEHDGEGIVLSAIGARCGKCFKADGQWTSIKNTITVTDFVSELVTRDFLFPLLNDETRWRKKGGGQPFIALKGARVEKVPLPPLAEQRRIVSKIESLQERSSRARRALSEVGPLLEQFRQSVLRAAFSGRLTADWRAAHRDVEPATELLSRIRTERRHRWEQSELAKYEAKGKQPPKNWQDKYKEPAVTFDDDVSTVEFGIPDDAGWDVAPLELLVDPERSIPYGIVKTGDPFPDGIPTVRCGDIKRFTIAVDRLKQVNPAVHEQYRRTWLEGGEVLIAIRGTVGETAVVPDEMKGMNISREVALIPVLHGVESRFLMYLLASPAAQRLITGQVKGVAQAGINLADLRLLPTPLPPLDEQTEIADRIEQAIASFDELRRSAEESESSLTQLDQSILAKAFRGELVPQDPRDEPASELLARIRTTREATAPKKKAARRKKKATTRQALPAAPAPPATVQRSLPLEPDTPAPESTEAPSAAQNEPSVPIDETDRNEVMAVIRTLFNAHSDGLTRDDAIRLLAHELGYQRTGHRIREVLGNDLIAALKRRILSKDGDIYCLHCRSIEDYDRNDLVSLLQRAMGNTWWDEAEAIKEATRLLGYRRTGRNITDTWKKTIALAIRRGELERDGPQIRRIR